MEKFPQNLSQLDFDSLSPSLEQKHALSCDRQKYPECDRCILHLVCQNLLPTEENTVTFHKEKKILLKIQQIVERLGVILVTQEGQVQFATHRGVQLLRQYVGCPPHAPPSLADPLQHWFKSQIALLASREKLPCPCLPLHLEGDGKQLLVRLICHLTGKHYLVLLEEQELQSFSIASLELLGLTKREAEVLFWVAKDKSNAAIAKVLNCSQGTVRKHLEHIYRKLGVQTRTAAVMVALEKLGLLKESFVAMSS